MGAQLSYAKHSLPQVSARTKWIILNWVLGIVLVEWALSKYRPLYIKNAKDKEMAEKYPEFRRHDLHKVRRWILYLLAPLVFIRILIGWGSMVLLWIFFKIFLRGQDIKKPIPKEKRRILKQVLSLNAKLVILMMSGFVINEKKYKMDYSKYLGQGWERTYKGASTTISNHQCFMDIMVHMYRQEPSHVSKAAVR